LHVEENRRRRAKVGGCGLSSVAPRAFGIGPGRLKSVEAGPRAEGHWVFRDGRASWGASGGFDLIWIRSGLFVRAAIFLFLSSFCSFPARVVRIRI